MLYLLGPQFGGEVIMWHYRPCKKIDKFGRPYYVVVEVYKNICGKRLWTEGACSPFGNSRKELIRDLEMMLEDCKRRRTMDDTKLNRGK